MSWQVANVRKCSICARTFSDKYGRTVGCPGCVGVGQHTEECRARIEQGMVDKGDAIKLEASGNKKNVQEPDVSLKRRKIGEPDINPGGQTPRRRESEQGSSADSKNLLAGRSQDRTALSGKFPEDELKAGREFELQNMWNF